jgi:hypothetical protein
MLQCTHIVSNTYVHDRCFTSNRDHTLQPYPLTRVNYSPSQKNSVKFTSCHRMRSLIEEEVCRILNLACSTLPAKGHGKFNQCSALTQSLLLFMEASHQLAVKSQKLGDMDNRGNYQNNRDNHLCV